MIHERKKKRKDFAFRRQFNEKPSIIPGCPGLFDTCAKLEMQSSMHSFNTCQKAMVLSPTKACRPELRLFDAFAKLECSHPCIHSTHVRRQWSCRPPKPADQSGVCSMHVQSLRCNHACIHSTHVRGQWSCHPPKPAGQSCIVLLHVQSLRCNHACTRSTHVFFQGQVHTVLSSSLYKVLFCLHLVMKPCILIHQKTNSFLVSSIFLSHLVMGLCIAHAGLGIPPVGECVYDVAHVPVLVPVLAQDLNPLVCNGHLQPVVKAHAPLCYWPAFVHSFIYLFIDS